MIKLPRAHSLRSYLIALVLAAVLPTLIFSTILLSLFVREQRHHFEQGLLSSTRALSSVVDEQIKTTISGLDMLASMSLSQPNKLRHFEKHARLALRGHVSWHNIVLIDAKGTEIFSVRPRPNHVRVSFKGEPYFETSLASGKPAISDLGLGKFTNDPVIMVGVPVTHNNEVQYVLGATFEAKVFSQLLSSQQIPKTWTVAIVGKDSKIIARSRANEKFLGRPITPKSPLRNIANSEGFFQGVNQEGIRSSGAFVRSPLTGWAVAIGVPKDALELPYAWIIPGGIGLLLIGLFLATWLGRHISQPVAQLGSLANALGKRAPLAAFRSGIIEVDQVVKSLELASSELDRSEKQLRGAIQLRDGFLSVASHELKTPLTSLQLQLQLNMMRASENTDSSSAFHTGLKVTLGQVERLIRLVNNLLDVTQITSGKMRMHLEPVDLAELANEIVSSFQFEVQKHRTSIQLEIQARPKACWDRGRVEQVLTNLVSNAIKYGEGRPAIVRIGALSDRAFIEVVDQGIGIHAEDLARIFERFERATSSSHISGLGLGLWITRRIVEQLGGKIGVQSVLNQGSAFTVELPLQ